MSAGKYIVQAQPGVNSERANIISFFCIKYRIQYRKTLFCCCDAVGVQINLTLYCSENLFFFCRWQLYKFLVKRFQEQLAEELQRLQKAYTDLVKLGDDLRWD